MGILVGQRHGIILGVTQTFPGSGERSCGHGGAPKKPTNTRGVLFSCLFQASPPGVKWLSQISAQRERGKKKIKIEVRSVYSSKKEALLSDRFGIPAEPHQNLWQNGSKTFGIFHSAGRKQKII